MRQVTTSVFGSIFSSGGSSPHRTGGVSLGGRSFAFMALALVLFVGIGPLASAGEARAGEARAVEARAVEARTTGGDAYEQASTRAEPVGAKPVGAHAAIFTIGGEGAFADLCARRSARIETTWLTSEPPELGGSRMAIFARLPAISGEDARFMRVPLQIDFGGGRGSFRLSARDVRMRAESGTRRGFEVERRGAGATVGTSCALDGAEILVITAPERSIRYASYGTGADGLRKGGWDDASLSEIERAVGGNPDFLGTDREAQAAGARLAGRLAPREERARERMRDRRERVRRAGQVARGLNVARQVEYMRGNPSRAWRIGQAEFLLQSVFGARGYGRTGGYYRNRGYRQGGYYQTGNRWRTGGWRLGQGW